MGCTIFVHACSELLSVRYDKVASPEERGDLSAEPNFVFAGSREEFQRLHSIVDLSLYLLRTHVVALASAVDLGNAPAADFGLPPVGTAASMGLGSPRLVQHLKWLRQFFIVAGGSLLPVQVRNPRDRAQSHQP